MVESVKNSYLQYVYLGVSLFSSFCVATNSNILTCTKLVGLMCLGDLYFVTKNDMRLHHVLVLCLAHYMNTHAQIANRDEIAVEVLRTEVSTIFLTLNNLLHSTHRAKKMNQLAFVSTFIYYRIYNYSVYFVVDDTFRSATSNFSNNGFALCEIYGAVYGLFLLNIYWCSLILKHFCVKKKCTE